MYEVCGSTGEMLRSEWPLLFNEKGAADIVQSYIIQLSPEGEVNIVVHIPRRSCYCIYQIS